MTEEAKYIADKDLNELNLVRCPKCEGIHFRHAGNVLIHRQYDFTNKRHMDQVDINSYFDAVNKALQADTKTDPHC